MWFCVCLCGSVVGLYKFKSVGVGEGGEHVKARISPPETHFTI